MIHLVKSTRAVSQQLTPQDAGTLTKRSWSYLQENKTPAFLHFFTGGVIFHRYSAAREPDKALRGDFLERHTRTPAARCGALSCLK